MSRTLNEWEKENANQRSDESEREAGEVEDIDRKKKTLLLDLKKVDVHFLFSIGSSPFLRWARASERTQSLERGQEAPLSDLSVSLFLSSWPSGEEKLEAEVRKFFFFFSMSHQQQQPPPHIPPPQAPPLAPNQQHWQQQGVPYGGSYPHPQAQMPGPFPGAAGAPMMMPPMASLAPPPPRPVGPSSAPAASSAPTAPTAPTSWTEHRAPDGRPYWACAATGQRSWSRPAELRAAGGSALEAQVEALAEQRTRWRQYQRASDGRLYYSHLDSRETSWTVPKELERAREEARREVEVAERAKGAAAAAVSAASAGAAAAAAAVGAVAPASAAARAAPRAAVVATAIGAPLPASAAVASAAAVAAAKPAATAKDTPAASAAAPPPLPGAAEAAKRLAKRRAEGREHMYDTKAEAVEAFFALLSGEICRETCFSFENERQQR